MPLGPAIAALIHKELAAEDLPQDRFGALDSAVVVAKTESRSVLGYMNEMGRFCEFAIDDADGLDRTDARKLNRALRRELHLSRKPPGYFVPIELAGGSRERRTNTLGRPNLRVLG